MTPQPEDWTFTYDGGDWTRFDNLKQVSEELTVEDGINDPWDGAKREWRTVRDANGNELAYVYSESHRYGECENAVIRETYRYEWTGLNGHIREADYWFDPGHRARHGKLRLLTGNDRPREYHDFDESGREILRVEQRNGSEIPGSFPVAVSNVLTGEVVTCTSRSSFSSSPLPTYTVTDYDAAYGLVVRRATHLTDGGRMLDEERIASFDTATGLQTESVSSARDGISTQCSCKRTRTERARTRPRQQTIRGLRRSKHTRRT